MSSQTSSSEELIATDWGLEASFCTVARSLLLCYRERPQVACYARGTPRAVPGVEPTSASAWSPRNSPWVGARLATTRRAFIAKVTLNIDDTPVRRWICQTQGHHHLHLLLGRGSGGDRTLPPRVAVAVCQPNTFLGECLTLGAVPGGRPSPGTRRSSGSATRRPPGLLPGGVGRSRDATREPSSVERIQLGFDSRFVS